MKYMLLFLSNYKTFILNELEPTFYTQDWSYRKAYSLRTKMCTGDFNLSCFHVVLCYRVRVI